MAGLPPWLDLGLPMTQGMVDELVRRARAEDAYEQRPEDDMREEESDVGALADASCPRMCGNASEPDG